MQLRIVHRTAYRYDEPVKYSAQALRLTPRREGRQRVLGWSMQAPGRRIEQVDAHGNVTHLLTVEDPHKEIEIVVTGEVEVAGEGELLPHEGPLSPLAYLFATPLTVANEALSRWRRNTSAAPSRCMIASMRWRAAWANACAIRRARRASKTRPRRRSLAAKACARTRRTCSFRAAALPASRPAT